MRLLPLFLALGVHASLCAEPQPNILFLLSDDQDWTGLSFAQDPEHPGSQSDFYETPNTAKLASEGMIFTDAYAPASVCSATRFSLQTGMSTARTGWTKAAPLITKADNPKLLPPPTLKTFEGSVFSTIGEVLQTAGYATAHYGKWHINGGGPEANGYDESDGENGNAAAAPFRDPNPVDIFGMGERASAFMEKSKAAGKPFFIQMSYHALHYPENARAATVAKYEAKPKGTIHHSPQRAAITEDLDDGVGKLLGELERLGLRDSTYVIYMSDNGAGGKRGRVIRGGKGSLWEGGIRSPLIVRGPGIAPGSVSRVRSTGIDLFPTFCGWAGVSDLPDDIDGGDLRPVLEGISETVKRPREEIVFHFPHYQGSSPQSVLYLGDYKIVRNYESPGVELYEIKADIGELRDLASSQPERAAQMHLLLTDYLTEVGAILPSPNPDYDPDKPTTQRRGPPREGKGGREGKRGKGRKTPTQ